LIKFIQNLITLDDFELLYNQNNLVLHFRKSGSQLTKDLFLAKGMYTMAKTNLKKEITIEYLANILYNPEQRMKWDSSLKVLKKLEDGEEAYVVRSWMHSPMFMVAEREVIDKRVELYQDGVFYCISTSCPDDVKIF
jgi:hypothetical protein